MKKMFKKQQRKIQKNKSLKATESFPSIIQPDFPMYLFLPAFQSLFKRFSWQLLRITYEIENTHTLKH